MNLTAAQKCAVIICVRVHCKITHRHEQILQHPCATLQ